MRLKVGDMVKVMSGDDKAKVGKILTIDREKNVATVEGVNEVDRHVRRSQKNMQGGRIRKLAPIQMSKLKFMCPLCKQATRLGVREEMNKEKGCDVKVRFCKKCGETLLDAPLSKKGR